MAVFLLSQAFPGMAEISLPAAPADYVLDEAGVLDVSQRLLQHLKTVAQMRIGLRKLSTVAHIL